MKKIIKVIIKIIIVICLLGLGIKACTNIYNRRVQMEIQKKQSDIEEEAAQNIKLAYNNCHSKCAYTFKSSFYKNQVNVSKICNYLCLKELKESDGYDFYIKYKN